MNKIHNKENNTQLNAFELTHCDKEEDDNKIKLKTTTEYNDN